VPGPVNAQPQGYLDSLGLKQNGRNPVNITDDLTGVLLLNQFYNASNVLMQDAFIVGVGSIGTAIAFGPVPQGRVWQVLAFDAFCTTGVGESITMNAIAMFLDNPVSEGLWPIGDNTSAGASSIANSGFYNDMFPILLTAGFAVGILVRTFVAAGNINFNYHMRYREFLV